MTILKCKGDTTDCVILEEKTDYMLLKTDIEYIVCWKPDIYDNKLSWGNGYYFDDLSTAIDKFFEK